VSRGAVLVACALASAAALTAEYVPDAQIPAEVRPFVERGTRALAVAAADLDGDGRGDFVLVLERQPANPKAEPIEVGQRPLLILRRGEDGKLVLAKRNDRIVFCDTCGGALGDPFQGVTAGPRRFAVEHYGGSRESWSNRFQFDYSRIDRTWQLVEVSETVMDRHEPARETTRRFRPPRDFGKIDVADFDPQNFKGRGAK
jgi:hypothetical protein